MAIALTPFEALCGFRPIDEIKTYLETIPELRAIVGEDIIHELTPVSEVPLNLSLKQCFQSLMTCDEIVVAQQLKSFIDRISSLGNLLNIYCLHNIFFKYCIKF